MAAKKICLSEWINLATSGGEREPKVVVERLSKEHSSNIMRGFSNGNTYLMLSILLLHGKFLIIMQIGEASSTLQHIGTQCAIE